MQRHCILDNRNLHQRRRLPLLPVDIHLDPNRFSQRRPSQSGLRAGPNQVASLGRLQFLLPEPLGQRAPPGKVQSRPRRRRALFVPEPGDVWRVGDEHDASDDQRGREQRCQLDAGEHHAVEPGVLRSRRHPGREAFQSQLLPNPGKSCAVLARIDVAFEGLTVV